MIITANIIIYLGYSFTKEQQMSIYSSKYINALHKSKDAIIKKNGQFDDFLPPPPRYKPHNYFVPRHKPRNHFPPIDLFTNEAMNIELNKYDLEVSLISKDEVRSFGELIAIDDEWKMYLHKGYRYFYFENRFESFFIKDIIKETQKSQFIIILSILLNSLFCVFYIFLISKVKPLTKLKENILYFSQGNLDIDTSCKGYDEISEVSNEFNNAIIQIRNLTNSRNLFLRNIMHEIKTNNKKGLLISNMLENNNFKESLKKAFFRLEYLLSEFARIEEFTSKNMKIQKEEFRIVDIIDHALDILLSDIDAIELIVDDNIVAQIDFELFALTIKNLLDNAMKYGLKKPKVILKEGVIYIQNEGEKLSLQIEEYNKPFNRKYENSNDGLGLGLYIVNNILKAHELQLEYEYSNNTNIFSIKL